MRKFGAAVAALASVGLLGVTTAAFVTAAQPGTTRSIGRLLSTEAASPSPSQASEQHNGSNQEQGGTAKGVDEHQQGTDEAGSDNDADEAEDQQGMDEAGTDNDADEADNQQGMDEHGPANQSDETEQR